MRIDSSNLFFNVVRRTPSPQPGTQDSVAISGRLDVSLDIDRTTLSATDKGIESPILKFLSPFTIDVYDSILSAGNLDYGSWYNFWPIIFTSLDNHKIYFTINTSDYALDSRFHFGSLNELAYNDQIIIQFSGNQVGACKTRGPLINTDVNGKLPYISTGSLFNSSNSTTRYVDASIKMIVEGPEAFTSKTFSYYWRHRYISGDPWRLDSFTTSYGGSSSVGITSVRIRLDAPPTFDASYSLSNPTPYNIGDSVTVNVSNLNIKYGGTLKKITYYLSGHDPITKTNTNPAVFTLRTSGNLTLDVSVTDSRDQVTTITVEDNLYVRNYFAPYITILNCERTFASGVPNEETGTYCTIAMRIGFVSRFSFQQPTVRSSKDGATPSFQSGTWFAKRASDGSLSQTITSTGWAYLRPGDIIYLRANSINVASSYRFEITPSDNYSSGSTVYTTIEKVFYTMDFLAGGKGIAMGKIASKKLLDCDLDAKFNKKTYLAIEENASSGNIDRDLYDIITNLGWSSKVISNDN